MLTLEERSRVCVVLVGARNPLNIGAVARAMRDFGFTDLRIVSDYPVPFAEARTAAIAADTVLHAAREFGSVAEAVADATLVVGTTAVGERGVQHPLQTLAEGSGTIHAAFAAGPTASSDTRIALLFGSEKTGLPNDALSHCDWLLHIPMHQHEGERHVSMNLGQAAAVCLYELVREGSAAAAAAMADDLPARAEEQERLTQALLTVMEQSGYTRRHPSNCSEPQVRRLVRRVGATANDAPVWMGVFKQILWALRGTKSVVDPD